MSKQTIPFIAEVSSFTEIIPFIRSKNTIVICDIDDTIITPDPSANPNTRKLMPTDKEGFLDMYEHIHSYAIQGTFMFLTARDDIYDEETRKDIELLGIPEKSSDMVIHYTNNIMSKGDYLYYHLREYIKYNRPIIFIDDRMDCIRSMLNIYSQMKCFLYKHNISR